MSRWTVLTAGQGETAGETPVADGAGGYTWAAMGGPLGLYRALAPAGLIGSSIQVTGGSSSAGAGPLWLNVATVTVPSLIVGEVLLVGIDIESSQGSFITYNTAVTTQVVCGASVGQSSQYAIRAATQNNTQNTHHLISSRMVPFVVTVPSYSVFTLMLAADSDVAGASDFYTVESLSGQQLLSVLRPRAIPS